MENSSPCASITNRRTSIHCAAAAHPAPSSRGLQDSRQAGDGLEVRFRRSNGNLHVRLIGNLDGACGWELPELIRRQFDGEAKVFIDVYDLGDATPDGIDAFRNGLSSLINGHWRSSAPKIFFKGKKGLQLAPEGVRVLVSPTNPHFGCKGEKCVGAGCGGACTR